MILLTGGTGLVGRAVLRELRSHAIPALALVRSEAQAAFVTPLGARPIAGRVEDPAFWRSVTGATAIVHGAALLRSSEGWPAFERVNVEGTRLAARRARELGVPLIHLSSVAVYGDVSRAPDGSVTEDGVQRPLPRQNLYARSKREAESAVRAEMALGLRATMLRPCPVYGEGDRLFLPRLVAGARRGWMPIVGNGDRPIPLVHAGSVARAVRAAVEIRDGWGRAYNLTNDGVITARDVVTAAGRGAGRRIRALRIPEAVGLGAATAADMALRLFPPGRLPGTLRTGVAYWRGGNPFSSAAARAALDWTAPVDHAAEIEEGVRRSMHR